MNGRVLSSGAFTLEGRPLKESMSSTTLAKIEVDVGFVVGQV